VAVTEVRSTVRDAKMAGARAVAVDVAVTPVTLTEMTVDPDTPGA